MKKIDEYSDNGDWFAILLIFLCVCIFGGVFSVLLFGASRGSGAYTPNCVSSPCEKLYLINSREEPGWDVDNTTNSVNRNSLIISTAINRLEVLAGNTNYVELSGSTQTKLGGFTVSGTITGGVLSGSGTAVTNLDAANLVQGTIPNIRMDQSSVTKLGAFIDLNSSEVSGLLQGANIADGATSYARLTGSTGTMTGGFAILGRLGVGTSVSPAQQLEVRGLIISSASASNNGLVINNPASSVFLGAESSWLGSGASSNVAVAAYSGQIRFFTNGASAVRLSIDEDGAPTGGALCMNSSNVLSKCTGAVDGSGNCTCP